MKKILDASGWIIIIAILASCSTTSKNKSSYAAKTEIQLEEKKGIDTTTSKKTDIQHERTSQAKATSVEEAETHKELNIDFGNGSAEDYTRDTIIDTGIEFGSNKISGERYVKVITKGPGTVKLNTDGSIEATGQIRSARYKETGKSKKQDSSSNNSTAKTHLQVTDQKNGIDTGSKKVSEKTEVVIRSKEIERTNYWGWLWLAIIIAAGTYVSWRLGLFKWVVGLFKRDKKGGASINYSNYEPPKPPIV